MPLRRIDIRNGDASVAACATSSGVASELGRTLDEIQRAGIRISHDQKVHITS
jgi:hypothetical protein